MEKVKKIVLIGASGFVGSALLNEALNRGFEVTAVVRHPEKIKIENENLKVVKADVSALDEVAAVCKGADAVISAFNPGWNNPDIYDETIKVYLTIIDGVKKAGVNRFLMVGGARRFCEARVWSYFNKFTDNGKDYLPYIEGKTNTPMPLFVKPKHKLSVQDVKDMMRDHYEGTPLDISNDFGAGPYKTPYRLSPLNFKVDGQEYFNERPISTQQSGFVFVAQMRAHKPDPIGGVLWFGVDDANMAVFTPVYCCATKVPVCYTRVDGADYITFSWNSAFWIFNWVSNMVYPRYDLMIGDVREAQKEMETTFNNAQEGIEEMAAKLLAKDKNAAVDFLTNYTNMTAQSTFDTWKQLGTFLIVKYNDGVVKRVKDGKFERNSIGQPAGVMRPGYPKEFLQEYVKQTGDRYLVK